jgi:hypothetical protein
MVDGSRLQMQPVAQRQWLKNRRTKQRHRCRHPPLLIRLLATEHQVHGLAWWCEGLRRQVAVQRSHYFHQMPDRKYGGQVWARRELRQGRNQRTLPLWVMRPVRCWTKRLARSLRDAASDLQAWQCALYVVGQPGRRAWARRSRAC